MKNNHLEVFIAVCLLVVSVLLLNPFDFWMPDMMLRGMLVVILVLFGIFASFVLREESGDEREIFHKSLAGRNAYLVGAGLLIVGIVYGGIIHAVNPWLVFTLMAMVLTKIGSRLFFDNNR